MGEKLSIVEKEKDPEEDEDGDDDDDVDEQSRADNRARKPMAVSTAAYSNPAFKHKPNTPPIGHQMPHKTPSPGVGHGQLPVKRGIKVSG